MSYFKRTVFLMFLCIVSELYMNAREYPAMTLIARYIAENYGVEDEDDEKEISMIIDGMTYFVGTPGGALEETHEPGKYSRTERGNEVFYYADEQDKEYGIANLNDSPRIIYVIEDGRRIMLNPLSDFIYELVYRSMIEALGEGLDNIYDSLMMIHNKYKSKFEED